MEEKDKRSDLEKFQEFFKNYGVYVKPSPFRMTYSGKSDGLKQYYMSGDKVSIDSIEGSAWCFDNDGNFVIVVEGS